MPLGRLSCVLFNGCLPGMVAAQTLAVAIPQQNRILLIDGRSFDTVATVTVGPAPHEIAVSPDGRRLYVGNTGPSGQPERYTVTEVDVTEPARTRTIDAGDCRMLHDVRASRSGRLLWIACGPARKVAEVDLATGRVARTWPTGIDGGWMLAASPDDRRLFVAHLEGQAVTALDRVARTVDTVSRPGGQIGIEVSPSGREVWVTGIDSGQVSVLDAAGDRVLATIPSGGSRPTRVRFTPDGRLAVIPHDGTKTLTLFDVATRRPVGSVALSATPKVLALSPDGRLAAVSHPEAKLISVVDLRRRAVVRTIALPGAPDGVAYVPAGPGPPDPTGP